MNLTEGRDPARTADEIDFLFAIARQEALLPRHLHIGFFQVRDLMRLNPLVTMHPADGQGPRRYQGVPYLVHSLNEGLWLCCGQISDPHGPNIVVASRPLV